MEIGHANTDAGILFTRGNAIWLTDMSRTPAKRIVALPPSTASYQLITASSGQAAVAHNGDHAMWVLLGLTTRSHQLPCMGAAALAPDGQCALCSTAVGLTIFADHRGSLQRVNTRVRAAEFSLWGAKRGHIVVPLQDELWAMWGHTAPYRQRLAPHRPSSGLLVAPNASRAVGVYRDGETHSALHSFRLDGQAHKRRLLKNAIALRWSHDSRWILAQRGERACIVRALGGQYKCWKGYRGVAVAPNGSVALLAKLPDVKSADTLQQQDLFLAKTAGPVPKPPKLHIRNTQGAAAWLAVPSP